MHSTSSSHSRPLSSFSGAFILASCLSGALLMAPSTASAESTIKNPNPPKYSVELEPKLNINAHVLSNHGGTGFGPGLRVSIPVMSPGFIKTINDSIAITFGFDLLRYSGYSGYYGNCGFGRNNGCVAYQTDAFWSIYLPVALQWNFWLTDRWSVFGEPGFAYRHTFYDDRYYGRGNPYGFGYDRDDFYFAFYIGGRFAITDSLALTMRLGHPTFASIGLSIFF